MSATETAVNTETLAGKYLTFELNDEIFGLEILKVREILGLMEITSVPRTPDYVKGVLNLRGSVIPIIDLRLQFGLPEAQASEETCIIVCDIEGLHIGSIVDRVLEVKDLEPTDIEESPNFGQGIDTKFILGMGKAEGTTTILLDIARVLDVQTARTLAKAD